jgi:hypothetical protein
MWRGTAGEGWRLETLAPPARDLPGLVPAGGSDWLNDQRRAQRSKLSTYSQGNPQKLSTGVEIRPAALAVRRKIASSGGQIRVAIVNYTLVSY